MTDKIKEYINSDMFERLFDDVVELVQKASDYLEIGTNENTKWLSLKEQTLYATQSTTMTNCLMDVSMRMFAYRAYTKGETDTLKVTTFRPYNININHNLPFQFNWLLTQTLHLCDRVQRIDTQLKNEHKSYFDTLTITL